MAILAGIATCVLFVWIEYVLAEKDEDTRLSRLFLDNWVSVVWAVLFGAVVWVIAKFAPKLTVAMLWLAPVMLATVVLMFVYLMRRWREDGGAWKEMIPFIILTVILFFVAKSAAWMTTAMFSNGFWAAVITLIPMLMMIATLGFFVIDALYFRYQHYDAEGVEDEARLFHILGIIAIAVTTLLLIIVFWTGVKGTIPKREVMEVQPAVEPAVADVSTPEPETEPWPAFYGLSLLYDDDTSNDYNFGYNAMEYHPDWTAEDYLDDMHERMRVDVVLGVADVSAADAVRGTRKAGFFFDETINGKPWVTRMNEMKEVYVVNRESYEAMIENFFYEIEKEAKVELVRMEGITDQMYQDPYTTTGTPDIIVADSEVHSDWVLLITWTAKDRDYKEGYRIACGYQPVNTADDMDVTPAPNPYSNPTPTNPPATNPPAVVTPAPTPVPETTPAPVAPTPTPTSTPEATPTPTTAPTPTPTPTAKPTPTPVPATPSPTPKAPAADSVNQGNADKGGGDNSSTDGAGVTQPVDPRTQTPTGSQNNNNYGHSDPATVVPVAPAVVPSHTSEPVVDYEQPMTYEPDPVTERGPTSPTAISGDGEFTPDD